MAKTSVLTAARLREILDYDPGTGQFTWREGRQGRRRGKVGNLVKVRDGYFRHIIWIDYKQYKAHRLAWLWMTGKWPDIEIDHINRNSSDNRWVNLRLATFSENQRNSGLQKNNTSGMIGVFYDKTNMNWRVHLWNEYIGAFKNKEEAMQIAVRLRKDSR